MTLWLCYKTILHLKEEPYMKFQCCLPKGSIVLPLLTNMTIPWSSITQQLLSSLPLRFLKYECPFHIYHLRLWQYQAVEESCRKELSREVRGNKLLIIHARVRDTERPADVVIDLASTGRKRRGCQWWRYLWLLAAGPSSPERQPALRQLSGTLIWSGYYNTHTRTCITHSLTQYSLHNIHDTLTHSWSTVTLWLSPQADATEAPWRDTTWIICERQCRLEVKLKCKAEKSHASQTHLMYCWWHHKKRKKRRHFTCRLETDRLKNLKRIETKENAKRISGKKWKKGKSSWKQRKQTVSAEYLTDRLTAYCCFRKTVLKYSLDMMSSSIYRMSNSELERLKIGTWSWKANLYLVVLLEIINQM